MFHSIFQKQSQCRRLLAVDQLLDIAQIDILFSKHKAIHTKRLYLQALRLAFFHFSAPVVPAFYRSIPVFFHDTVAIR